MTFRICTIGCGHIATGYHGPAYRRYVATHPDTELAACCDLDEARARQFAECFGFARHYTDLEAMIETERPGAVCMMVSEPFTCEVACRVLRFGVPLMTEKPPGRTTDEIERMIAAAEASGAPTQVAFNRRHLPLARLLRSQLAGLDPAQIQHVRYDLTRIGRTDADFSLTAIHGIDAVRYLAGSDYAHVRFHYQELPEFGPTVANIFMDCILVSGGTAHLDFCPVAGVVVERATIYAHDHTFFLNIPIWNGFDAPGRLQHLERGTLIAEVDGITASSGSEDFILSGFYAENASFFDDIRSGRRPTDDLRSARQSVEVAQCIRERVSEYHATRPWGTARGS